MLLIYNQKRENMKLQPADLFTRIFFILLLTFVAPAVTILGIIAIIQLVMDAMKQQRIDALIIISQNILGYVTQVIKYLTVKDHPAPFPFSPWINYHET